MSEALRAAPAFTVHAEIVYDDVATSGRKLQFAAALDAALRRPDGLVLAYTGDIGGKQLWYDGKAFTLLDVRATFVTEPAPPTTTALLAKLATEQGLTFPLADLVADDPYAWLTARARSGIVVGPGDVNGITCHHLAFVQNDLEWQIWIDAGGRPLPRKLVIYYANTPGVPQYSAVLSDWKFPKTLPAARFAAELPKDAHRVEVRRGARRAEEPVRRDGRPRPVRSRRVASFAAGPRGGGGGFGGGGFGGGRFRRWRGAELRRRLRWRIDRRRAADTARTALALQRGQTNQQAQRQSTAEDMQHQRDKTAEHISDDYHYPSAYPGATMAVIISAARRR